MEELERIENEILRLCRPQKMILFGQKKFVSTDRVRDVDICLVMDTRDKLAAEKKIYLGIDSDISFDLVIYTPAEWEEMLREPQSFASRILEKGTCIWDERQGK